MGYDIFINYQNEDPDKLFAAELFKDLIHYRAPGYIRKNNKGCKVKDVFIEKPCFKDTEPISRDVICALEESKFMVVVCSPRTRHSTGIIERIELFLQKNTIDNVLALLIEGEPEQSFPDIIRSVKTVAYLPDTNEYAEQSQSIEPLAADIRANSLKKSLKLLKEEKLRLLAPVLGRSFDDLRQRHRERLIKRIRLISIYAITASILFGAFGFFELVYARTKGDEARVALEKAAMQAQIAARQKKIAEEILLYVTEEVPKRFERIPEASSELDKIMEQDGDVLKSLMGNPD